MQKCKKFLGLLLSVFFVFNCTNSLFAGGRKPIKRGTKTTVKEGRADKKRIIGKRRKTGAPVVKVSELGKDLIVVIRDREISDDQRFDEVVEFLQDHGEELFQEDLDLALGWAVQKGCVDVVELLLANKANVNADNINRRKMTPLLIATHKYRKIVEKIGKDEFLRLLKILVEDYKANVNKQDIYGDTALLNLSASYDLQMLREKEAPGVIQAILFLLNKAACANTQNRFNEYPYENREEGPLKDLLWWQCCYDNYRKFKLLNPLFGRKIKKLKKKVRQMQ